ncbi:RNA polymerase sigma factor FliA [Hahella sp. CCB-MM4]|uniref:RNA polymerase sigma factor FliA n=1 Tax=Hahella sp. (strain CCB-MM4) TaxID=1926491 RepID=UPI000B9A36A8|nr:RNA polymerase sigma factor FliA [Hahella sp. CCB-MM4]
MHVAKSYMIYSDAGGKRADLLVQQYAPLVKRIAHHLIARLPASVQVEDLIQSGMIGLLEAAQKYDATKGASFETYAGIRIRGSMMDEIRKGDWIPRSVHRNARNIAKAIHEIEARTGRDAQDHEVAEALGITLEQYHSSVRDASAGRLFSLDEMGFDSDQDPLGEDPHNRNPLAGIENEAFLQKLTAAIDALPEREKLVLSLYYDEELNLKEIGQVLSVSESRVSQIHSQATIRLRSRLTDWTGD